MHIRKNQKKGFTVIEVLVSVGIIILLLPFAANMLTNSKLMASYSKHKIQAAFAAQQILETQRQNNFVVLSAGASQTIGPSSVVLDTMGSYANPNCATNPNIFCGTASIKITPAVYTSTTGVNTTSTTVDHYVVTISWLEQILGSKVAMTEIYAEDIANDTMLN